MASLRQVCIGSMNRHPVMHDHIAGLHDRRYFAVELIRGIIHDPLRESENLRFRMLAITTQMGTIDVAQASVLRIHVIECRDRVPSKLSAHLPASGRSNNCPDAAESRDVSRAAC